jgi:hypothetical protein
MVKLGFLIGGGGAIADVRDTVFSFGIGDDDDDDDDKNDKNKVNETSIRERHDRIRWFVRFVVGEYKSLKSMGCEHDSISLYRISLACSKIDATRARERASKNTAAVQNVVVVVDDDDDEEEEDVGRNVCQKSMSCHVVFPHYSLRERHCARRRIRRTKTTIITATAKATAATTKIIETVTVTTATANSLDENGMTSLSN